MIVTSLEEALRSAQPTSDETLYCIIHLPPSAITAAAGIVAQIGEPFLALTVDEQEVTLVAHADAWDLIALRLPDAEVSPDWRLITFDATLDHSMVGFMARISTTLAEAGVSIYALSAYRRDHLLVKAAQFDAAFAALTKLANS